METKETIEINKYYTTTDLCLAVILKMNKGKLEKVEVIDNNRFRFCFKEEDFLNSIVKDYFTMNTEDHPYKKFYNEMREIKNMIYNYKPPLDK